MKKLGKCLGQILSNSTYVLMIVDISLYGEWKST